MHHDIRRALDDKTQPLYTQILSDITAAAQALRAHPIFALPTKNDDLTTLTSMANDWRTTAQRVVVIGTGGASLGGQALVQYRGGFAPSIQNQAAPPPQILFSDMLAPEDFAALADDITNTRFLIISKSGETAETLTQTDMVLAWLKKSALPAAAHMLVITSPDDNTLHSHALKNNLPFLPHATDIGGRFSVFSNVGLLPALLAGADAAALRAGAAEMAQACFTKNSAALCGAALHLAHMRGGRNIAVLLPYNARLERTSFWHRQLWAESLGKQGQGSMPVNALGPRDQHSQLQRYCDGADDTFFTLITTPPINNDYGQLLAASAQAMGDTLAASHRPVRILALAKLDDFAMGGLLMHFMAETIFTALGLGVNAFDQPAVDDIKQRTRAYRAENKRR